ncbi:MAG: invasion associated locus B family protein [Methyloligellaceae bacterium]
MTKQPNAAGSIALAMPCLTAVIFMTAIILGSLIQAAPQALAQAKANTKRSFGDWQIDCGKPPGARTQRCALLQSVIDEERSNVGLRVVFLLTSKGERVLRVVAPLGVLLPFGLGLRIDKEPIGDKPLPFVRCRPMGCISEIIVKDALLDKFKTGTTALFIIVETKEEGRAIPVSLKGFTQGFEQLTALSKAK